MHVIRLLLATVAAVIGALVIEAPRASGGTPPSVDVVIARHARLTADGGIVIKVWVRCGPLPGTPDFREGHAGASQARTGAAAEGGLSPDVTCDGGWRRYEAAMSSITDASFRRGKAHANASVIACNTVGDEQLCVQDSASRRVVILGRRG